MRKIITVLSLLFLAISSFAISTKNSEEYNYKIKNQVLPYFNLHNPEAYKKSLRKFEGHKSNKGKTMNIAYDIFGTEDAKYHIVILHGLGETYVKYAELMYDLEKISGDRIRFYVMDHRGFGFSDRFNTESVNAAHMDNYNNAIDDVKTFMDKIVIPDVMKTTGDKAPVYLFAHSMGGGIATRFLEVNHGYFDKVILNSPMQSVQALTQNPYVDDVTIRILTETLSKNGWAGWYFNIFGKWMVEKPYNGYIKFEDNDSKCTNNPERYYFGCKTIYGSKAEPGLYLDNTVGGFTFNWLYQSSKMCMKIARDIKKTDKNAQITLFQAENDHLVNNKRHNLYAKLLNNCNIVRFKNIKEGVKSRHELYMEIDEIRGSGETLPNINKPVTVIDNIVKAFELDVDLHINASYI